MSGLSLLGVNLSGAEYNSGGTRGINFDYTYPSHARIDNFAAQGMTAIRLPFLLERVEPVMNGPLNTTELGYIDNVVNYAASKGITVILDPHNYGYAWGSQIGSAAAPNSAFANFWGALAGHFASSSNVMFGLMNEPIDIPTTQWLGSVNAAISAIRASGATSQQILVPGTYWDTASSFVSSGNAAILGAGVVDPSHNFAFEVHQYLDSNSSGTHADVVSATVGVSDLQAVTQWAAATGNKLFLGEFGVSTDGLSLQALDNMLSYMQQNSSVWEGGTYWAAGAWLGNYMYSINPVNGVNAAQMGILDQYVPSLGAASAIQLAAVGNQYALYTSAGTGPSLKYAGVAVTAGQFANMTPVAAGQAPGGYEVVWKLTASGQFDIWTTDSNGNYISDGGVVASNSNALETAELALHQDLNGDGVTGFSTVVIASSGSNSLVEVGSNFYLETSGSGPSLKYVGVAVTAGQFGAMAPIGAAPTPTGYQVVWKATGADQYTVWTTDSSGNYVSAAATVSGTSYTLESLEVSFMEDLNGDGIIGIPGAVMEARGSTALLGIGNYFYLDSISGGTAGVQLKSGGAAVTVGQFGNLTPIGAEQTSAGYEVAWKNIVSNTYTVWNTDSSGNFTGYITQGVSGTSVALQSLETSFQQDLNGDGIISTPGSTVISAFGSTSLVEVGNNFFLNSISSGSGPELTYAGVAVTDGQFGGGLTPIGVGQTTGGYEVAWKSAVSGLYSVWNTDGNANFTSYLVNSVAGTTFTLQSLETSFHQDLNSDGVIGVPGTVIEAAGSTALVGFANNFYLDSISGGTAGVALKYGGAAVTAAQFGALTAIAVEQTATGYEVAWKNTTNGLYTVWNTDSSGNFTGNLLNSVSGTSVGLKAIEASFHQDLNGDGIISSPVTTVISAFGSTSLVEVGNNFFLNSISSGSGPELKYAGAAVTDGQFGAWTPIGVEQTSTGYEVAWKMTSSNTYSVWTTDSSGNFTGNLLNSVSGTSVALELQETGFQQDLNRDGVIGLAVRPGGALELTSATSASVTFQSSTGTLKLDTASTFTGQILGFTGNGTLTGSDQIDLVNFTFNSTIASASTYNSATGLLQINNGTSTVALGFAGTYVLANFKFASDGHGGTIVYDPPVDQNGASAAGATGNDGGPKLILAGTSQDSAGTSHDGFQFKPASGPGTQAHPISEIGSKDQAVFAATDAHGWAAVHHGAPDHPVITDAFHAAISADDVTVAQWLAHHAASHLI